LSAIRSVVCQAYDVREDERKLRSLKDLPSEEAAAGFEGLRTQYNFRPEFHHFSVDPTDSSDEISRPLRELGFQIGPQDEKA
jgi:hypothetical protein